MGRRLMSPQEHHSGSKQDLVMDNVLEGSIMSPHPPAPNPTCCVHLVSELLKSWMEKQYIAIITKSMGLEAMPKKGYKVLYDCNGGVFHLDQCARECTKTCSRVPF